MIKKIAHIQHIIFIISVRDEGLGPRVVVWVRHPGSRASSWLRDGFQGRVYSVQGLGGLGSFAMMLTAP